MTSHAASDRLHLAMTFGNVVDAACSAHIDAWSR